MQELGPLTNAGWKICYNLDSAVHVPHSQDNQLCIENIAFHTWLEIHGGESAVVNAKMVFSMRSMLNL